jgi:hypothetical protein
MGTTRELRAFLALEATVLPSLFVDRSFWVGLVKVAGSRALSYRHLGPITGSGAMQASTGLTSHRITQKAHDICSGHRYKSGLETLRQVRAM